jgi:hypothetical protein
MPPLKLPALSQYREEAIRRRVELLTRAIQIRHGKAKFVMVSHTHVAAKKLMMSAPSVLMTELLQRALCSTLTERHRGVRRQRVD